MAGIKTEKGDNTNIDENERMKKNA